MRFLKAFIAGLVLPALISPFIILYLALQNELGAIAHLPFVYFGPLLWGAWNIVFVSTRRKVPINSRSNRIGMYGAFYGLCSALINSLYFEFTSAIPSLSDALIVPAVIAYPILLFFAWKYIVNALNLMLEVY